MEFYEVTEGDTLIKISIREGIPLPILKKINRFWDNSVFPGQIIRLKPQQSQASSDPESQPAVEKGDVEDCREIAAETSMKSNSSDGKDAATVSNATELCFGIPVLIGDGIILKPDHVKQLCGSFPQSIQIQNITLLYSVLNNGADITSFYKCTRRHPYTLIIVLTEDGELFGGFVSGEWRMSQNFHGNGESFIFSINEDGGVTIYNWTGVNEFFVWSTDKNIAMGGGGDGFGFVLDSDFESGESCSCNTYGNQPLTKKNHAFQVVNVECWGFEGSFG